MHRLRLSRVLSAIVIVPLVVAVPGTTAVNARASDWTKSPHNPMLSLGGPGDFDHQNIFAPAVAKRQGKYYLFYSGGPDGPLTGKPRERYQLGLALSDDGVHWKQTGEPLLPLGQRDDFHCTPALLRNPEGDLLKHRDLWHLVYCGNRANNVEHATSPDGLTWTKDPRNPIFRKAYAPNLVQVGDQLRMYYISGDPWGVYLATGPDLYSLAPCQSNPVLAISQQWEHSALFYPYVLREGKTWLMFYASYWTNAPGGAARTATGMATSPDGIHWKKHPDNPVLTPTPGSAYDSVYTSSQAAIRDGDHYKMYYAGRIDTVHKYYSINLATKPGRLVSERR